MLDQNCRYVTNWGNEVRLRQIIIVLSMLSVYRHNSTYRSIGREITFLATSEAHLIAKLSTLMLQHISKC